MLFKQKLPILVVVHNEGVDVSKRKCEKQREKVTEKRLQSNGKSQGEKNSRGEEKCRVRGKKTAGDLRDS